MSASQLGNQSTESEVLFEQYLTDNGYTEWTHEEPSEGKPTTPDYRLRHGGEELFFEVKEFDLPAPPTELVWFDSYEPLRKKIKDVRRQFKAYRDHPCSLVLANPKGSFVFHHKPTAVFGAMFGNLGIQIPVGPDAPLHAQEKRVFGDNGMMRSRNRRYPQHTTISAIISLTYYPIHAKRLEIRLHGRATELGQGLSTEELVDLHDSIPASDPMQALRVVVFENPDARIRLPPELFCGPFDERWGLPDNQMKRVFMGTDLLLIESAMAEAKKNSPLQ